MAGQDGPRPAVGERVEGAQVALDVGRRRPGDGLGPRRPVYGSSITVASPAINASRSGRCSAQ